MYTKKSCYYSQFYTDSAVIFPKKILYSCRNTPGFPEIESKKRRLAEYLHFASLLHFLINLKN